MFFTAFLWNVIDLSFESTFNNTSTVRVKKHFVRAAKIGGLRRDRDGSCGLGHARYVHTQHTSAIYAVSFFSLVQAQVQL
jgi:hypothetical protein